MGQGKFLVSILFIAIFTIAIVSYVSNYATDNNANINLGDDVAFTQLNSSLQGNATLFVEDMNDSSAGFTRSQIAPASDTLKSPSIFQNIGFAMASITTVLNLMRDKIFGGNPAFYVVLSAISGFILFLVVMFVYKSLKTGDPS